MQVVAGCSKKDTTVNLVIWLVLGYRSAVFCADNAEQMQMGTTLHGINAGSAYVHFTYMTLCVYVHFVIVHCTCVLRPCLLLA